MIAAGVTVARVILFLIAFFWIFSALFIVQWIYGRFPHLGEKARETIAVAVLIGWIGLGYGLFAYGLPAAINPWCKGKVCDLAVSIME